MWSLETYWNPLFFVSTWVSATLLMYSFGPSGYPGWRRHLALALVSVPIWWWFELINARVQNWKYIILFEYGDVGYALLSSFAFSTVVPAASSAERSRGLCAQARSLPVGCLLPRPDSPSQKLAAGGGDGSCVDGHRPHQGFWHVLVDVSGGRCLGAGRGRTAGARHRLRITPHYRSGVLCRTDVRRGHTGRQHLVWPPPLRAPSLAPDSNGRVRKEPAGSSKRKNTVIVLAMTPNLRIRRGPVLSAWERDPAKPRIRSRWRH